MTIETYIEMLEFLLAEGERMAVKAERQSDPYVHGRRQALKTAIALAGEIEK